MTYRGGTSSSARLCRSSCLRSSGTAVRRGLRLGLLGVRLGGRAPAGGSRRTTAGRARRITARILRPGLSDHE